MTMPCTSHLSPKHLPRTRQVGAGAGGFTLTEVMITVAIVAILATIALPSYSRYIERARVQEALQGLAESRTKMEQFYMDNRSYNCDAATDNYGDYFTPSCDPTDDGYTLTATGNRGTSMAGFQYTINAQGVRGSDISKDGWNSGSGCWISKPGESC